MRYRYLVVPVAAALAVALLAWASAAGPKHPGPAIGKAGGTTRAAVPQTIPPILYNQNDNNQGLSLNGQDYDVQFSTFSLQEADDFTITGGQTWKIQQIDVTGVDHGPGVPFATVEI